MKGEIKPVFLKRPGNSSLWGTGPPMAGYSAPLDLLARALLPWLSWELKFHTFPIPQRSQNHLPVENYNGVVSLLLVSYGFTQKMTLLAEELSYGKNVMNTEVKSHQMDNSEQEYCSPDLGSTICLCEHGTVLYGQLRESQWLLLYITHMLSACPFPILTMRYMAPEGRTGWSPGMAASAL